MKSIVTVILCFCSVFGVQISSAQCNLNFKMLYYGDDLVLDSVYRSPSGDVSEINSVKFYISSVKLLYADGGEYSEENSFHLLDAAKPESLILHINNSPIEIIKTVSFNLGIDSLTNVSGAMGGDLDPTKGMYWTWQNGFINCKLEGKCSRCLNPKHEFQFHLGGYQYPFATLQKVVLNFNQSGMIKIEFNLNAFLKDIDLEKYSEVSAPNAIAVKFSEIWAKSFIAD